MNKSSTATLAKIEAIARRNYLASAPYSKDRFVGALILMAIQEFQKNQNDLDSLPLSSEEKAASPVVPTTEDGRFGYSAKQVQPPRRQGQRA